VGAAVPEHHDRPPSNLALQVFEERDDLGTFDRLLVNVEIQSSRRRDATDRRELRPAALVDQRGCLSSGRPGLRAVWDEREAALIEERYDGPSASGSFSKRGQERLRQFFTARSFFSLACRRGRCHERPWRVSKRHMALSV
jgi:hypothetical protein